MKSGTAEQLQSLPKNIPHEILSIPGTGMEVSQFIAKSIYEFHYEKEMANIQLLAERKQKLIDDDLEHRAKSANDELAEIKSSLLTYKKDRDSVKKVVDLLGVRRKELESKVTELAADEQQKIVSIRKLVSEFERLEGEMNSKLQRLKNYIEEKASFLSTFDFIDEEDLDAFLFDGSCSGEQVEGVSFAGVLNGDYRAGVSYIQAHLANDDILYPRHVIENYLTLLRTKDLIILAGDSGSGKTNLVKSFAKAVGGKAVIIPVKPNWTGAEDLLGYYNPLEKRYLATPFLDALIDANNNPNVPYFICLDEMNLARVEYYFADFLSLLETRDAQPEIPLYSDDQSSHVLSELKAVVDVIHMAKERHSKQGVISFIDLLKDEELIATIRTAFGFSDKDSLIKYHGEVRRMLSAAIAMPSRIRLPNNVHIIGAINIDETTHYLSPKILDRAHVMRFESPLLSDWDQILLEIDGYGFDDVTKPLLFNVEALGRRVNYPKFDRDLPFCKLFVDLNREFFQVLGVEFGMRAIRQGLNYIQLFTDVNDDADMAINNFILHKVLPKFTFDGSKTINKQTKLDVLENVFTQRIKNILARHESYSPVFSAVYALERMAEDAKINDGIVNFWS